MAKAMHKPFHVNGKACASTYIFTFIDVNKKRAVCTQDFIALIERVCAHLCLYASGP